MMSGGDARSVPSGDGLEATGRATSVTENRGTEHDLDTSAAGAPASPSNGGPAAAPAGAASRGDESVESAGANVRQALCEPTESRARIEPLLRKVQTARGRPLFVLVSHFIDSDICNEVYRWKRELRAAARAGALDVLLHSPGGDLTACYVVARLFSRYADSWEALVPEYAASGATLICLGSSRIVMSDFAQLGPLDPQVLSKRRGEFFMIERQSPLEAFQAVRYLGEFALTTLDASMAFLLEHMVAPQPALDTASRFAVQLAQPMLDKIEPFDLGAFALNSSLAIDYCRRVCKPSDARKSTQRTANYRSLVEKYPAHEFVIDITEAETIGLNVCEPSSPVDDLFDQLREHLDEVHAYVGFTPQGEEECR